MSTPSAPTASTSPSSASDRPKESKVAPPAAVSFCVKDQAPPERTKTYTAPTVGTVAPFAPVEPTRISLPEAATDPPKNPDAMASGAVSFCAKDHVVPERTNTYAAPALVRPGRSPSAPTTIVSPDTATAWPKKSPATPSGGPSLPCPIHPPPLGTRT